MSTSGLSDSSFRYEKFEVSLIQSMTVQPCQPTKRHIMSLSGFDRVSPALMYTVFFYKAGCDEDEEKMNDGIVETIRKALEKVLVSWYPAAGRFRINEETGKLELDCNEAGSVLVEACTSATLEDLGRLSDYKPFYEKLVPKLSPSRDDLSENPLLVAQITRFGCGSLSLGFGSSHALFDGVGAFNFLKAWASLSSGSIDESQELLAPNHSRDHLLTSAATNESIYNQYNSMPVQDLYGIPMSAKASDDKSWETTLFELSNLYQGGYDLKTFLVKQEIIDSLKKKASGSGQLSVCSSFDVLTAQVWRARVKALGLCPTTKICLQFTVDARNLLDPPLGRNFSGNAFVLASTSCVVSDLIEEPLHCTVGRVQTAKDAVRGEYIRSYLKALEAPDKFFPSMRELTIVSDWRKIPFHGLDFGWGKAVCAAPLATPVPQTAYFMQSPEEENIGTHVRLGLLAQHVDSFQKHLYDC